MEKILPLSFLLLAVSLALFVTPSPALAEGELAAIRAAGRLRVGTYNDNPPFGYINSRGRLSGYDIFLARRLAKDLLGDEDRMQVVPVIAASRIDVLENDTVDIILANFTVTPERAKRVDFATPYMKTALAVISPENAPVSNTRQLAGHKLIVIKSSTSEAYFTRNHPDVKLLAYEQHSQAFNALLEGRAVAMAHDSNLIYAWLNDHPGYVTGIVSLDGFSDIAPAVKKGNTELLEWVNKEMEMLQRTGVFTQAYEQTLRPVFGDKVDPGQVLP